MSKETEHIESQEEYASFHSEEVQEIMGRQPSWILRWGITVIFGLAAAIILGCYFIKYPQTVSADITTDFGLSAVGPGGEGQRDSGFRERVQRGEGRTGAAAGAHLERGPI
jgi:hypothetical protein